MTDATATVETVNLDDLHAVPTVAAPAPAPTPAKPRASRKRSARPPKATAKAAPKTQAAKPTSRTRTIEIDEELHGHRETVAVRLAPNATPYAIWNCADSPGEAIRADGMTLLRFRNGLLECRNATDDAVVKRANTFAGGKYIRAEEKYLTDPFTYTEQNGRVTRWYSKQAYERYVALHPQTA